MKPVEPAETAKRAKSATANTKHNEISLEASALRPTYVNGLQSLRPFISAMVCRSILCIGGTRDVSALQRTGSQIKSGQLCDSLFIHQPSESSKWDQAEPAAAAAALAAAPKQQRDNKSCSAITSWLILSRLRSELVSLADSSADGAHRSHWLSRAGSLNHWLRACKCSK